MIPQQGKISIDQSRYQENFLSSLENISLVSQDVILFDDTIENNIAYANSDAS